MELLIVLYLAGLNFVPGGHQQFQLWYQDLIPLALMMTGLPAVFTYKLYNDIYPSRIVHPNVHHMFSMALALFLLTIGPGTLDRLQAKYFAKSKIKKD